jgi:aryl-alcohol dehydrogenase-like predicted oxidoreductase
MEYLDLYMIHWPLTPRTYLMFADTSKTGVGGETADSIAMPVLEDAVACLVKLQQEGKIRYLGLSNYGVERMKEIRTFGADFAVNEIAYNLITRAAEMEVLPYCEQVGTGAIAYMVLMQGLLTNRYASLEDIPDWYTRTRHFDSRRNPKSRHGGAGFEMELSQVLRDLKATAKECGYSSADLALKWAVAAKGITCALVGTQNVQRLEQNVRAIEEKLPAEILERLTQISQSLKEKLGPSLDIFESIEIDRTR